MKRQAAEVLADRRLFLLDGGQWKEFMMALGTPPPMPRLEKLLSAMTALPSDRF